MILYTYFICNEDMKKSVTVIQMERLINLSQTVITSI